MEYLSLTLLIILPGVWCGDWGVTFANQICVLKGASVLITCNYNYPFGHLVRATGWSKALYVSGGITLFPLSSLYSAQDHYKFVGNSRGNCNLQINNVQLADEGAYYFSFVTTFDSWKSKNSVSLSVRELTAVMQPRTVIEGGRVRLTCRSGCSDPRSIVWFRDGQPVSGRDFRASRKDAGKYLCAVLGQETVRSDPVALSVQYAPEEVRLYLSSQKDIIQGSSVTLVCRSDASPSVESDGYSLFKDGQLISSGWLHTFSNVQPSHRGWYHCQAWNNVSRGGFDRFNSTQVRLDVHYLPRNISVSVTPQRTVEGSSVNMSCSSDAFPAAHTYSWFKHNGSGSPLHVGSGPLLSLPSVEAAHAGLYFCNAANHLGASNSSEVLLTLEKKQPGVQTLPVLAGIGASLVVTLIIALLFFWRKQRTSKKQTLFDMQLSGKASGSLPPEDPSDPVYANVNMAPSSPPPAPESPHHQAFPPHEDEVTYTTVTIKPKNVPSPHPVRDSRSSTRGNEASVIYATLAEPR